MRKGSGEGCVDLRVESRADPCLLRSLRGLLGCYLRSQGFPEARADEIVLAVDEACTNAIRHSYGGPCDEPIEIVLGSSGEGIEITVSDRGRPAPKEAVAPREVPRPDPATVKPGGLGIGLLYRVFDSVDFRPGRERGNSVRLFLRRPGGAAARGGRPEGGGGR